MQNKVFILAALLFSGCGPDQVTEYACGGTVVTRVDKGATSQFFYGTYAHTTGQLPVVEAQYPGFDGYMAAYLTFEGKQVELQPAGGYFHTRNSHPNLEVRHRDNPVFMNWQDSIRHDMRHTVYVTNLGMDDDTKWNQHYHSGVKTTTMQVRFLSNFSY